VGSSFGEFGTPTPQTPAHPASRAPKSFFVGKNVGKSAFKANKRRGYLTTGGDGVRFNCLLKCLILLCF